MSVYLLTTWCRLQIVLTNEFKMRHCQDGKWDELGEDGSDEGEIRGRTLLCAGWEQEVRIVSESIWG